MLIENAQEEGKRHPSFPPAKRPANFNNYASEAIDLSYNSKYGEKNVAYEVLWT